MQHKRGINRLLDVLIGLLALALVGAAIFAVSSFRDSLDLGYDADSFYYRLTDGDYGAMVEMYYTNESLGIRADEELRQYYAIARYYEAASWHNAYRDREEAARYLTEMEAARADMGPLAFVADEIQGGM